MLTPDLFAVANLVKLQIASLGGLISVVSLLTAVVEVVAVAAADVSAVHCAQKNRLKQHKFTL